MFKRIICHIRLTQYGEQKAFCHQFKCQSTSMTHEINDQIVPDHFLYPNVVIYSVLVTVSKNLTVDCAS